MNSSIACCLMIEPPVGPSSVAFRCLRRACKQRRRLRLQQFRQLIDLEVRRRCA
jgi:hypothetical protein